MKDGVIFSLEALDNKRRNLLELFFFGLFLYR